MTAPSAANLSPCALCGATDSRLQLTGLKDYITGERFILRQCAACGLVVTDPIPPTAELGRYYPARYRTDRQKQTGGWRVGRRATTVGRYFPPDFRGRLLDLGCGTGAFAMEMQRRGWTVAVTELNDAVLDDMRSRGMEAKSPDKAMRDGFAQPFDVITCWHVLEHVPEPLSLAKWSQANLADNGIFQATVPNFASWQANMFGRNWLHLDVPRHLYHFTPGTLNDLVRRADMEIVASTTFALEYDLFGVIQSGLNAVCSKPNVLFERLTARDKPDDVPAGDVIKSYLLAPFLGAFGVLHCGLAAVCGAGATLTVTCRRRSI